MFGNTPFNDRKDSNVDMTVSGEFPYSYFNNNSQAFPPRNISPSKIRFQSLIAIGNPMVDITEKITRPILDNFH